MAYGELEPQTFEALHKDIKLVRRSDNTYDRAYLSGDYVRVEGLESVQNGALIALQTRQGEMNEIETYSDFGSKVWLILKDLNTELKYVEMEGYTRETLEKIRRLKSVDTISVTEDPDYNVEKIWTKFVATSIDDRTFQWGAELGI